MPTSEPTAADVLSVLEGFPDPETGRKIGQQGQLADVQVEGSRAQIVLKLSTHSAPLWNQTRADLTEQLQAALPALTQVEITVEEFHRPPVAMGQMGLKAKSVIAVGSGKGGVGKSTIASTIALGLNRAGCKVGLLDADVYGPSVPHLLGADSSAGPAPELPLQPVIKDGLKIMSIGFLVEAGQAVIWRGPMLHKILAQFLGATNWGELDYLIIDMPPGTGDVALSLSQLLPLSGAVVVCTPQQVALLDAEKAIAMFNQVKIPVLGMVENMSHFDCPDCGKRYDIFGTGGAKAAAEAHQIPFLGDVPINMQIRVRGDDGQTVGVYDDPDVAPYLETVYTNLARQLSKRATATKGMPSLPVL